MRDVETWGVEEFGHAELGDARRTKRLVRLAVEAAGSPTGIVSKACRSQASQEGAFRWLESDAVHVAGVQAAVHRATARRCTSLERVIVPLDGSSLSIDDDRGDKGLGAVGPWSQRGRGVKVMSALAVSTGGATLGICAQRLWVRHKRSVHGHRGALGQSSENDFWLETMTDAREALARDAPGCSPWFQMDRGADCWQVLEAIVRDGTLATVRAAHDRLVDDELGRLWTTLESAEIAGRLRVRVPPRPSRFKIKRVSRKRAKVRIPARTSRIAKVTLRARPVPILCRHPSGQVVPVLINAVLVKERRQQEPIEWLLLTTHPIETRHDVVSVVRAYSLRWRIEDFHRTWKRGLCRVEDTQLRSRNAIYKWATILGSVATRALRLTHLARTTPDVPASTEFSDYEIEAMLVLRQPKNYVKGMPITLGQAVRWVADLGGYSRPKQGPPGPTVIGRGLYDVVITARAFETRDKMR